MLPIPNFPGYYADQDGNIWSTQKYRGSIAPRRLRPAFDAYGYLMLNLRQHGKSKTAWVHRLVALAYHENPNQLPIVCHKNDVKVDNQPDNLYWGSSQDNAADKISNNKHCLGVTHGRAKLSEYQVQQLLSRNPQPGEFSKLGREYGVTAGAVSYIAKGINWKHITIK